MTYYWNSSLSTCAMIQNSFIQDYKGKKDKKQQLMKKLNELNSYVNLNNCYRESEITEGELRKINDEFLADQSLIFKNTSLLNDCKPTKEFLTMEQRKIGCCCISKLKVNSIDKKTGEKVELEVIEPKEIRDEMKKKLSGHFCKANNQ